MDNISELSQCSKEIEGNLIPEWLTILENIPDTYKEPILSLKKVLKYKEICEVFLANTQVFIMSIEITEDYIRMKRLRREQIPDFTFVAVISIFLSYKNDGAPDTMKINRVSEILFDLTKKWYRSEQILEMEGEIITTLEGKLPITTKLDDLNLIIAKFINQYGLKENIRPLCIKLLECVYIERQQWFKDLKDFYSQGEDCLVVFRKLMESKFYIPMGVLLAALFITNYRHVLNLDSILNGITKQAKVHQDHLYVLALRFMDIFYD